MVKMKFESLCQAVDAWKGAHDAGALAIATVVDSLSTENLDGAVNMATSAMEVRGFEDLKLQRGEVFLEDLRRYLAGVTN